MGRPYLFLHIPKTAGTTLNTVFDNNMEPGSVLDLYTEDQHKAFADVTYERIARYALVRGHVFIQDFEEILDGPVRFKVFTFLRDPVQRVISEYNFLKRWPKSHLYEYLNREDVSLVEYVTSDCPRLRNRGRNNMVNSLSGVGAGDLAEGLELAWHHLKDRFVFFGILERFDESLLMLRKQMGLGNTFYEKQNMRISHADVSVSRQEFEIIREYNRYDLLLYERAVEEFSRRVSLLGPAFQSEVRLFYKVNARFQKLTQLVNEKVGLDAMSGAGAFVNPK